MTEDTKTAIDFTVSDNAAKWIKRILEDEEKDSADYGLRIGVRGGGCSGFQYDMFWDKKQESDYIFETNGAKAFIDPKSAEFVKGSQLLYQESLQGAGFAVINPNVSGTCGCGTSFSV